jgi:hypothetical protein
MSLMQAGEAYLMRALEQVPRLLSQVDRCGGSPTFGCFDRNYWHYRIVDFPCARHQAGAYALAQLYSTEGAGPYYRNRRIREWAQAGLDFWARTQNSDGSFDEWYPMEHSFPATAFSTVAAQESLTLIGDAGRAQEAVDRACGWLRRHREKSASNQEAAAILALSLGGDDVTGRLKRLLDGQTGEGWFMEYGGFDAGYSYVLLDNLSRVWEITGDEALLESILRLLGFLSYFIHPDGSSGGCYTSRNTGYMMPAGVEMVSAKSSTARAIANAGLANLAENPILWDDRYLCYNLYSTLQAYSSRCAGEAPPLPHSTAFDMHFPQAGLHVSSDGRGAYLIRGDDGRFLSYKNGAYDESSKLPYSPSYLPNPYAGLGLRLCQLVAGRSDRLSGLIKGALKKRLITKMAAKENIYVPSARYFNPRELS